ncbi:MAG TPA: pseudouridine synthase [Burkholderiaceae bacterium]|nr:pseudouridine synthase [Burkholderiaceae bacterium]
MNHTTAGDDTPLQIEAGADDVQVPKAAPEVAAEVTVGTAPDAYAADDSRTEQRAEDGDEDEDEDDFDDESPGNAAQRARQAPRGPREAFANRFADVVSGQFDADEEAEELPVPKRVLAPQVETPKLHKVLAQAGLGSRLEMEQLIMEGRISVNNEPAHIGQRIQFGDQVKVNGKPIRFRIDPPPARVIAYHKPVGEVVTNDDPQNRPTVFRKLPKLVQGKWQSVGRLDLNTEGLLLFTSSGELANKLMHPRFGLEREYAVRVLGALSKEEKQRLLDGVKLDDGMAQFGSIEDGGGEGSNCWYRVTISEGRNREVRRMLEAVGHAVSRLIRIRYGAMLLPRGLKRGGWMELDERDIQALVRAAGAPQGRAEGEQGEQRGGRDAGAGRGGRKRADGTRGPGPRGSGGGQRGGQGQRGRPEGGGAAPGGVPRGQGRDRNAGGGRSDRDDRLPGGAQPDPMKTAFGYIGADSFTRQRQGQGQGQGQGQRRGGGSGGGGGGGGGQRRGGRGR